MPDLDAAWNRAPDQPTQRWRRFTAALPMRTALLAVAGVWVLGAIWSFQEQTAFATAKGFGFPHLLPLVIDGFAVAMAGVAWAASLDARPAVAARLATVVAVGASSASNGAWAYLRSDRDLVAVLLGVAVPLAANLAFEVLLAELRRQVQRRRGLPPPVAIPYPRLIRLGLAPLRTFAEWRAMVLELTAMEHTVAPRRPLPAASPEPSPAPAASASPAEPARSTRPASPAEPAPSVRAASPVERTPSPGPALPIGRPPAAGPPWLGSARLPVLAEPTPALAEPTPTESGPTEPTSTESGRTEPTSTEPGRTEPTSTEPGRTEPTSTEPGRTEPTSTEPGRTEPTSTEPGRTEPTSTEPGPTLTGPTPAGPADRPHRAGGSTAGGAAGGVTGRSGGRIDRRTGNRTGGPAHGRSGDGSPRTDTGRGNARRPVDPRVELLARHLAATEDAGEFTGEMVGPLLNIDVAPRTGRRLLGQARELVSERARAEADEPDRELRVIGGR